MRTQLAVISMALLVAGCGAGGVEPATLATTFIASAAEGEWEASWTLLHPSTRRDMFQDDPSRWARWCSSSNWSQLKLGPAESVRDDAGDYIVSFPLVAGPEVVPRCLVEALDHRMLASAGMPGDSPRNLTVRVLVDRDGGSGVWYAGG